ncbi:MAG TPA: 2,3-bisphosphoglycerate-independent phosphoglycerate mutase [Clostridiaceae bacterium]|jgi:2,3-bisphosphoglycerate-independent phosphoglycerate mutase|nr:2,3-bisphosphoglycerate-independent phosphoglycerate mutase [Clostridiaceae bacterium]
MVRKTQRPIALIILDGWGISDDPFGNAVLAADTPFLDHLIAKWPVARIKTSGSDVGLPDGQMGNSEVGHMNIGAGRIVYQDLLRISNAIEDGTFFENEALYAVMSRASSNKKTLHLAGLLSDGGVHSHLEHLFALIDMAKRIGVEDVAIHAFFDGRDTPPKSGINYMAALLDRLDQVGLGRVATLSGRYYAMDRDNRWDRVERAYRCLTAVDFDGVRACDPIEAIRASYERGVTDEFIEPVLMVDKDGSPIAPICGGDSFIFINFRPDRARELTRAFCQPGFDKFPVVKSPLGLHYVGMTEYSADFITFPDFAIAFPPEDLTGTFGEVVADAGLRQLRIAETEKYAHVTFFFNGGREEPYRGEERVLVPSPKVETYDLQPEMSAPEVTDKLLEVLNGDPPDVIILNYANGDMVGHTGLFDAACQAMEAVDRCLSRVVPAIIEKGGIALITADHGNLEEMIDRVNGGPFTAHTTNDVWLIGAGIKGFNLSDGRLADLAPTMLELLELERSTGMTGRSLLMRKEESSH